MSGDPERLAASKLAFILWTLRHALPNSSDSSGSSTAEIYVYVDQTTSTYRLSRTLALRGDKGVTLLALKVEIAFMEDTNREQSIIN